MKANLKQLAIALGVGISIGSAVIQGLHAQATPPTYVVVDISEITDPEGFKTVPLKAVPAMIPFGGKLIIGTENITARDGTAPKGFAVIAFDSLDKAKAWSASADQKEVDAIRAKTTARSRSFFVEGK